MMSTAKRDELAGHLQLLVDPQREPGSLFAVAQGRVEDGEPVADPWSESLLHPLYTPAAACSPIYSSLIYISSSYAASGSGSVSGRCGRAELLLGGPPKLHRTQPAVSQAVRRIEDELGERLFDRSSRDGTLTEAGRLLQEYAQRLLRLAGEAEVAVRELQQVRRGRVILGANEAAVHSLLPYVERFAALHPEVAVEVRRVPSRQMAEALLIARSTSACSRSSRPIAGCRRCRSAPTTSSCSPRRASARHSTTGHARGGWASGRHRPQRTVADPRARAPRVRATPHLRSTFRYRSRASTASSARSKWASAWRCCRAGAR